MGVSYKKLYQDLLENNKENTIICSMNDMALTNKQLQFDISINKTTNTIIKFKTITIRESVNYIIDNSDVDETTISILNMIDELCSGILHNISAGPTF